MSMIAIPTPRLRQIACAALLIALLLPALLVQRVGATTRCVNPGGTGGCFSTIQAAIDDPGTMDGDTIIVAPNNPVKPVYTESLNVTKSVAITGTDIATTIIDGTQTGESYAFFTVGSGKVVNISGLTLRDRKSFGGYITNGGILTATNSDITISDGVNNYTGIFNLTDCVVKISANPIYNGSGGINGNAGVVNMTRTTLNGGISDGTVTVNDSTMTGYVYNTRPGTMTFNNSTINLNILNSSTGTISITSSVLSGNISNQGAGTVTLRNTNINAGNGLTGNASAITNGLNGHVTFTGGIVRNGSVGIANGGPTPGQGGGIYNAGTMTLTDAILTNNHAYRGGGMYNVGTVSLTRATVDYNSVLNGGAGIYNAGTMTLMSSTLDHNLDFDTSAITGGGAGIYNDAAGVARIINATFASNVTEGSVGGAIFNAGTATLINDTISGNGSYLPYGEAAHGGGISNYGSLNVSNTIIAGNSSSVDGPDISGSITSNGHNLIGDTSGGSGFIGSDLQNVNPLLGPFAGNGGPTFTLALLPGSPAIGAGDTTICAAAPPNGAGGKDQRGLNRAPDTCSIGSYEIQPNALPPPKPTAPPGGSPTALPPPRPTAPLLGAGTPTPNPLPPPRP